jgi:hypothetical protein
MNDKLTFIFLFAVIFLISRQTIGILGTLATESKSKIKFETKKLFRQAPFGIKAYVVISYIVIIVWFLHLFLPDPIRDSLAPLIGSGSIYPYTCGAAFPFLWLSLSIKEYPVGEARKGIISFRKSVIIFCYLGMGSCVFDYVLAAAGGDYGNPCLMFSPYRWILDFLIPIAWISYFRSKKMMEYFSRIT